MGIVETFDAQAKRPPRKINLQHQINQTVPTIKKELDYREREYLVQHLSDPMLFDRIVLDGLDHSIVNESTNRKVIFLCAIGSLVENANRTSYNLMVNSASGAGKDYLVNNVLKILPQEDLSEKPMVYKRTRISPTALTYWNNSYFKPNWTWNGKVLYLEDCSNNILNSEVFKVFTSNSSHATIVKDQMALTIKINGKPTVILTSASADPHPEIVRRFVVINLDEGKEQTGEVMEKWCDFAVKGEMTEEINYYHEALQLLKPVKVKIPFAKILPKLFLGEHIIMRTFMSRFLDYIKASCALHQYQREKDVDELYIANGQDYNIAREVLQATSSNDKMIPLTKNQQEVIKVIKEMGDNIVQTELGEKNLDGWTHNDICSELPYNRSYVYELLNQLTAMCLLEKHSIKMEYSNKRVAMYKVKEQNKLKLPTWEELIKEEN